MLPATIGFSDRHHGFIGGSYNGTLVRYARTLTDESGLYGQRFWYDALGRIVLSQNTKQFAAVPKRYSYSLYDALGRVYEAGELDDDGMQEADLFRHVPGMLVGNQFKPDVIDPAVLTPWVQGRTRREVTRTWWDAPMPGLNVPGFTPENLRLRVASTTFREAAASGLTTAYDHATHYSYDIHGNVKELVQDIPQLGTDGGSCTGCVDHRYKKLRYTYDLISGNVLRVDYGTGDDQMHHRYTYDADNRITEVETSADAVVWHRDAEYFYYPHGPLQRVELGEHKVQGVDYAYTLQGWLKGINSDRLQPETDMGQDGLAGTANEFVGRDAYGESIGYFGDEDYKAIDATRWGGSLERPFAALGDPQTATGTLHDAYNPLYNGNIAHTVNSLQPFGGWTNPTQPAQVLAQVYRYDQLNRLKQAQGVEGLTSANTWDGITDAVADRYKSQYTYDANGNIETVARFDETGTQYDNLQYHYEKNGAQLLRNRLYHLNETIDGGYGDIGIDASTFHAAHADVNALNNYKYDELGNLIADKREEIANIEWTVSGKVKHITRTAGSTKPELWFAYGADGQRMSKTVGDPLNGGYREYYLRDAQGNVMAMYKYADNGTSLKVTERPVYGSSRIGSYTRQLELMGEQAITTYPYIQPMQAPLKRYELTDHLGNVNTVVTGRLLPLLGLGVQYQAEVVSAQGYESFGSLLPGRNYSSDSYRFGFQGQIKDDEVYGAVGTSYTALFWQYDPRTGRRWNLDPKPNPSVSDYSVMLGNPIRYTDPLGDSPSDVVKSVVRGIGNVFSGRPWGAKHSTNLGNNRDVREWGSVRNSGGIVADSYMANLQTKENEQRAKNTPEGTLLADGYQKLHDRIAASFRLNVDVGSLVSSDNDAQMQRLLLQDRTVSRSFLAPETETFQGQFTVRRVFTNESLSVGQNGRQILSATGPAGPGSVAIARVRSGDVFTFTNSRVQPQWGLREWREQQDVQETTPLPGGGSFTGGAVVTPLFTVGLRFEYRR